MTPSIWNLGKVNQYFNNFVPEVNTIPLLDSNDEKMGDPDPWTFSINFTQNKQFECVLLL